MPDIRHLIEIAAPPTRVFDAIATKDGIRGWWTPHVEGDDALGGELRFAFDSGGRTEAVVREREPGRRVRWDVRTAAADDEWNGTSIVFDIAPGDDGESTVLRFSHTGWRATTDFYARCNYFWGFFMRSVRSLVEEGRGYPQ